MFKKLLLGAALAFAAQTAQASLVGDSFSFNLQEDGAPTALINAMPTVGSGPEIFSVDINSGLFLADISDDLLTLVMAEFVPIGATTWSFTGLDYSDGSVISGFTLLNGSSPVGTGFGSDFLTVNIGDISAPGIWVFNIATEPGTPPSVIPLPAGGALLIAGLGSLILLRRRARG
ncbi:VPLPA-CTERM sorting domain-containing protein [Sulfitobacter sp. D35]|uniref:VPLPA-CTERM sorting domain-containing protein n=1 Tax=Sulfitobacter sp. D35 TaxID=3083252 RepID=UPI00296F850A|nr:VPLPA-CTERM sorting domain-containing protein [Sulfitobacter sp. D35]MDW4497351.1 VPLPA-CTERM sorting domain-containing protein [Sulfitobacter sp. D35]